MAYIEDVGKCRVVKSRGVEKVFGGWYEKRVEKFTIMLLSWILEQKKRVGGGEFGALREMTIFQKLSKMSKMSKVVKSVEKW